MHGLSLLAGQIKAGRVKTMADARNFGKVLSELTGTSIMSMVTELAPLVARSLDLSDASRTNSALEVNGQDALVDALPADDYLAAAREVFDPRDFFYRAPARVAVDAMVEMAGSVPTKDKKKGILAALAVEMAQERGWLPRELRSAHYGLGLAVDPVEPPRKRGRPKAAAQAAAE